MSAEVPQLSVVTALRQSRKGKLNYDRHWTERNSSVERVLKEVTEKFEIITVSSEKKEQCDQTDFKISERTNTSTSTPKSSLSKKVLNSRMRDSLTTLSPLNLDKSKSSLPGSPGVPSPVIINMNRTEERDIVDPRNIVMSSESSLNTSLSTSYLTEEDPLSTSSFSYETPNLIKYNKFPRVDVKKLRFPPKMFVGPDDSQDESLSSYEPSRLHNEVTSPNVGQSEVEDEIVKYELDCKEEAERRVQERKVKWEQQSKEKEEELREELEKIKRQHLEEEQSLKSRPAIDLEKEVEQTLRIQMEEREERQKTLILLAKKEEQLAKEKQQKKIRIGQQMERLAPLQTVINNNLTRLLELWSKQEDKKAYSQDLTTSVPKLINDCNEVCEEARKKVVEGECGSDMFDKLTEFDASIKSTALKIEQELEKIIAQRKEEEEKAEQQKKQEEEEKKKAAEEKAKQEQLQQQQQLQQQTVAQTPVIATAPVTTPAATSPTVGTIDNKAWYDETLRFKSEFIKTVVFTDQEKQFKFDLQKAVNTPINSLSGVSSAHLQDKVDKLVALLSGEQVTVGDRTISVQQHPHARSFCMGLAAKKLARQGEDVVTSDHGHAFPAATFALAIWDKFPDFGKLLLAYMFEMCPFLVPYHPQQTSGQSDKDYYTLLGYKYEKDVVETQEKYLKRMSGLGRLYAALSVSHLPKNSQTTNHPHPPARLWCWLGSILNLNPHTDVTARLILDILEVAGHTMFASYGKQFGKLLEFIKSKYFSKLESVMSAGGHTARLDQFLVTAIRGGSIKEPDGALKPGFL